MTLPALDLLLLPLREPERLGTLTPGQWDLLVRQGRRADVLARVAERIEAAGRWADVPPEVARHLQSMRLLAQRQHEELRHETGQLLRVFESAGLPLVLLKGAAYVLQDLRVGEGRMVSDIDILVPRERLADVESALMLSGWVSTNNNPYDQRYYRTWMHELPPMRHLRRGTVLDVHHALVPLSGRLRADPSAMLADIRPIPGNPGVYALSPTDMVLHSAAHLYAEGELELGCRGLLDIELLVLEFAQDADFWPTLTQRAAALRWERPLAQALVYLDELLSTPLPPEVRDWARKVHQHSAPAWRGRLLDAMYLRALRPDHASLSDRWTALARAGLYVRGHWLRMPPWLLAGHLARKALMAARAPKPTEA